jgi:hypothetical protein
VFELDLYGSNDSDPDYLRVLTSEKYSDAYVVGEDADKIFRDEKDLHPEFYTILENEPMQFNRLHALTPTDEIPVGLILKENGEYTIELNKDKMIGYEGTDLNIYLVDKYNGNLWHNLLEKSYTFNASGTIEDRFVLRVANAPTGILTPNSNIIVYADGNAAHVRNLTIGDEVSIYNINGQLVSRGTANTSEQSYRLPGTGVYVVKVAGSETFVSKVINK